MTPEIARREAGYSRSELASIVSVAERSIQAYELGARRPSPEVARKLAGVLGLTIEQMWKLFYGNDDGQPSTPDNTTERR